MVLGTFICNILEREITVNIHLHSRNTTDRFKVAQYPTTIIVYY